MFKTAKNRAWSIAILAIVLLAASIIGVYLIQKANNIPKDTSYVFNYDQTRDVLSKVIPSAQEKGGGFHTVSNMYLDSATILYSTCHAYSLINHVNRGLSEASKKELAQFLDSINDIGILTPGGSYDDIPFMYYYIEMCNISNYDIDKNLWNDIVSSVKALQSDLGYFYRSSREKEELSTGEEGNSYHDPIKLLTTYRAICIAKNEINADAVRDFFHQEIARIDWEKCNDLDLMAIAIFLLSDLDVEKEEMADPSGVGSYLRRWIQKLEDDGDAAMDMTISNLSILYEYVYDGSETNADIRASMASLYDKFSDQYINLEYKDYTANDLSFHIVTYNEVYKIIQRLKIEDSMLDEFCQGLIDALATYKSYDNSYVVKEEEPDEAYTYYATAILSRMNLEEKIDNQALDNYIRESLKNISPDSALSALFTIRSALLRNINADQEHIIRYLEQQCEKMNGVEYAANIDRILVLLSTLESFPQVQLAGTEGIAEFIGKIMTREYIENILNNEAEEIKNLSESYWNYYCGMGFRIWNLLGNSSNKEDVVNYIHEFINSQKDVRADKTEKEQELEDYMSIITIWHITQILARYDIESEIDVEPLVGVLYDAICNEKISSIMLFHPNSGTVRPNWEMTYYVLDALLFFHSGDST